MVSEMPLLWLSDKLSELCFPWKLFSRPEWLFSYMSCCASPVRDVHSFFNFLLKIFASVMMSFIRFLLSIVVHFFISSFIITFFLRYSCFLLLSFFQSVHNFYEPYNVVCVRLSTQYRKVNINLPNWLFMQILNSIWMKSSPLLMMMVKIVLSRKN